PLSSSLFPSTTLFRSDFVSGHQPTDQLAIERLDEAQIGDGGGEAARFQLLGCLERFGQAGAERQQSHLGALPYDTAFADLEPLRSEEHTSELQSRENL